MNVLSGLSIRGDIGGRCSITTKISGGRQPQHHHQDLSTVRFIDLFDCDRYDQLITNEYGVFAQPAALEDVRLDAKLEV
jgi:hypothetical protein